MNSRARNGELLHVQRAFLLDAQASIRGIYDASAMLEMHRMVKDDKRLWLEKQ